MRRHRRSDPCSSPIAPLAGLFARRVLRRTQLSEQERAWQDRFQSLVQSASDVILVVDSNGAVQTGYLFAKPLDPAAATAFLRQSATPLPLAG